MLPGTYIGSSYSYATARDFARFLIIILLQWLVEWRTNIAGKLGEGKYTSFSPADKKRKHYGYQFWLNGYERKRSWKTLVPRMCLTEYVFCRWLWRTGYIYYSLSEKLVVGRLGLHVINENKFLKEVIEAMKR